MENASDIAPWLLQMKNCDSASRPHLVAGVLGAGRVYSTILQRSWKINAQPADFSGRGDLPAPPATSSMAPHQPSVLLGGDL